MPGNSKPPSRPKNSIRSSTGVVTSKVEISFPLASTFMMPPISPAVMRPPNISPSTLTAIAAMSVIGNSPRNSFPTSIFMPSIAPEKVMPASPLISVTLTDRVSTKSAGSAWMSGHWMPISVILIGRNFGHLKLSPVAEPMPMKTPKPCLVTKVPSPRKAKFRASPESLSEPIVTSAPSAAKLISSSLSAAPVSRNRS